MATGTGRRNRQRNSESKSEDASKLIRENMKCPVCLEVLLPPIYQCETGHNICYLCVDEVTECPLCKSDYGDTRNYFAEELVNSMIFPCKYEEYGCHKTFLGSQLKEHQENCECQPYRCPELACQEVVGIHQMAKHLDKHGFKIMKGEAHQASVEILDDHFDRKTEYNPWRISAFGVEFYTVATRSREGLWYFWAYGLGLQKDIKKISYEIVLYSDEKQIMYRGVVQSLRVAPEDVMKNGSCLITMDSVIKSIRKNGRLKCQIYIIQGKNWDFRSGGKMKANQAAKNMKKLPQKGKNKLFVSNTSTFTCSGTSTPASFGSRLASPKCSRSRVLHNSVKVSAIDMLKKVHGSSSTLGSGRGSLTANKSTKLLASKSRPSHSRGITVSDEENAFVLKIRETLRCPGCNEVITPPVFQCLIGHNVCHKCKTSRSDCALCRAPLSDSRNFFAEELLYKTLQRCTFSKHGCKVCLPSAQMRSHEAICEFAPFECPFNVCRTLLSSDELFEHLQTHQISVVDKELKTEIVVPRNAPAQPICTIPNILTVNKVPFYPIVVRDTDGSWLFYIITQNHNQYRYELLIKKQAKTIAFQGPVLSLRTNFNQVKQKGLALIAAEKTVKSFKSSDKLNYQIRVVRNDPGALTKDNAYLLSSSWVLVSRGTDVVSKTELFANKRTSVSPEEESDEEEDTVSIPRNNPTIYISESEDVESEVTSEAGTSLASTNDEESEYESEGSQRPDDAQDAGTTECSKAQTNEKTQSGQETGTGAPEISKVKVSNQAQKASSPKQGTSTKSSDRKSKSTVDINNNIEERPVSGDTYATSSTHSLKTRYKRQIECDTVLKGQQGSPRKAHCSQSSLAAPSLHHLKIAKDEMTSTRQQNDGLNTEPQQEVAMKRSRSRSASRNKVRLSEDVIQCPPSTTSIMKPMKGPSRSQGNLNTSPSRLAALARTSSKHVVTTKVWIDEQDKSDLPVAHTEFGQLTRALQANSNGDLPMFEDSGDLFAAKSLNGMSDAISAVNDAVITGGFDVVKSVIGLFTTEDKTEENKEESLEKPDEQVS